MKNTSAKFRSMAFATLALSLTLFSACQKDSDAPTPPPAPSPYIVMDLESGITPTTSADSKYGNNLYQPATDHQYIGYHDPVTDLQISIIGTDFWNGGLVPSIYNDMETEGFTNQCSVYFKDAKTGFGGNNGSKAFIVGYCGVMGGAPEMRFKTPGVEKVIDHLYVTNNTYATMSMRKGDQFAKVFSYEDKDWFKLTFTGLDKADQPTGSVDFFMADFRTADSPGIVTKWTKVDLSSLGSVHSVAFAMTSTDGEGMWMNTPAYFCIDDIAVQK